MQCSSEACQLLMSYVVPSIGVVTAVANVVAPLRTVIQFNYTRSLGTTNPIPYAFIYVNALVWINYGLMIRDYFLAAPNLIGMLCGAFYTRTAYRFATKEQRKSLDLISLSLTFFVYLCTMIAYFAVSPQTGRLLLGSAAILLLVLFYSSPLSALIQVLRTRNSAAFHVPLALASFVNGTLWTVYGGIVLRDPFVYGPNGIGAIVAIIQLACCVLIPAKREAVSRIHGGIHTQDAESSFDIKSKGSSQEKLVQQSASPRSFLDTPTPSDFSQKILTDTTTCESTKSSDTAACDDCPGLLDDPSIVQEICANLKKSCAEYDAETFNIEIILSRYIAEQCEKNNSVSDARSQARKAFNHLVATQLEQILSKKYTKQGLLTFEIVIKHALDPDPPQSHKQPNKKLRIEQDTEQLATPIYVHSISIRRAPIFIGGRYLKVARNVSQTPWLIDGVLKTEHSVSGVIIDTTLQLVKADGCGFVAAGREDADVRMLGSGRPFFLELKNVRNSNIDVTSIANAINDQYGQFVQVKQLRQVDSADTKLVKEGEELKSKTYSCLIWAKTLQVEKVERPNLARPKTIHWMNLVALDEHFAVLKLETQAGTYIKEFVTGDMGRTFPNLSTLLDATTDILELDVVHVALNWPSSVKQE